MRSAKTKTFVTEERSKRAAFTIPVLSLNTVTRPSDWQDKDDPTSVNWAMASPEREERVAQCGWAMAFEESYYIRTIWYSPMRAVSWSDLLFRLLNQQRAQFKSAVENDFWFGLETFCLAVRWFRKYFPKWGSRPRTCWRVYISHLACESLGTPQEVLQDMVGQKDRGASLLCLLPLRSGPC